MLLKPGRRRRCSGLQQGRLFKLLDRDALESGPVEVKSRMDGDGGDDITPGRTICVEKRRMPFERLLSRLSRYLLNF